MDLARDEQLRRFEALISATSDFIAIASVDGKVEFLNQDGRWNGISTLRDWRGGPPIPVEISSFLMQAARVLGYAPGENLGACLLDLIHPDDRDAGAAHFEAVFAQAGLSPAVELRLQTADGSWRRYEAIANNLLDDSTMAGVVFHR